MSSKWTFLSLIHFEALVIISASITGVTYWDHFDFQDRYQDVNGCNPFYWYPLHLPPECAYMFDKVIRSKFRDLPWFQRYNENKSVESPPPNCSNDKRKKERSKNNNEYSRYHGYGTGYNGILTIGAVNTSPEIGSKYDIGEGEGTIYNNNNYEFGHPAYNGNSEIINVGGFSFLPNADGYGESNSLEYEIYEDHKRLTPYERMLRLLMKDVQKEPSYPKIGLHPHLGPVAVYNQEISKKSDDMIKKVATAYGKFGQQTYIDATGYNTKSDGQLYYWDSRNNKTKTNDSKKKKHKKNNRITRTKTKIGNMVAIVETLEPKSKHSASHKLDD